MTDPAEHPAPNVLAGYAARRLTSTQALIVSDHLAICASCREKTAALRSAPDLPLDPDLEPIVETVTYAEMAALLDGELDADQVASVRSRVNTSPYLTAELNDLAEFRRGALVLPAKVHGPGADATNIVAFPGWWRKPLAAAATVLLVAALGWWTLREPPRNPGLASLLTSNSGKVADVRALPLGLRVSVEKAAATGEVAPASVPEVLRPDPGTLAGESGPRAVMQTIAPVGVVVRSVSPRLRWTACPGASAYAVSLAPLDSPDQVQNVTVDRGSTECVPPHGLVGGTIYQWQVEALSPDGSVLDRAPKPPAPEARFQVLTEATSVELTALESKFGEFPLVLGVAYQRAGLKVEAAAQFQRLAREHPHSTAALRLER